MPLPPDDINANITPTKFELLVKDFLTESGENLKFFNVQHNNIIPKVDGNYQIDVYAELNVLGVDIKILIECKRHKQKIKREVVQLLYDKIRATGSHKGMIFSTSGFQKGAYKFAIEHGIALIRVIEGKYIYCTKGADSQNFAPPSEVNLPEYVGEFRDNNYISYLQKGYRILYIEFLFYNDYLLKFSEISNKQEIEPRILSCLSIALKDARFLTARDIITGEYLGEILKNSSSFLPPHSFIGIINYLLILDMIVEIFKIKNYQLKYPDKQIYCALEQFGENLSEQEIYAIVDLRNCLAHNYGLANLPINPTNKPRYSLFTLSNFDDTFLIRVTNTPWDGTFNKKDNPSSIVISVPKLIEKVEETYKNLVCKIKNGNIELRLKDGINELRTRFTIRY
jgi:restriction system protein